MTQISDTNQKNWTISAAALLITVGTISRLTPLLDPQARLLRQFISEDGYLMQTVARNLGIGLGVTVSDGTVPTNGVQPLATLIFSLFYLFVDGDKIYGIAAVTIFSGVVSCLAAYLVYLLAKSLLKDIPEFRHLPILIAAVWFATPVVLMHTMNGLETGLYILVSLATLLLAADFFKRGEKRLSLAQMIGLGLMFGVCFWARNDAVFLIGAMIVSRFVLLLKRDNSKERLIEAVMPGAISLVVALPWIAFNYRLYGSIVPISGISEALGARFGQNAVYVPAQLLEFVLSVVPIPQKIETNAITVIVSLAAVAACATLSVRLLWKRSVSVKFVILSYGIFGTCLICFYGLYFGAPYFMSRYLSVLSPFLAIIGFVAGSEILRRLALWSRNWIIGVIVGSMCIAIMGLNARIYHYGLQHGHFQVVQWVEKNLSTETWVGAVQTGTLGFFHDRTINLDGKVDPGALTARIRDGDVISYVLQSDIPYLVDWAGLSKWMEITRDDFNKKYQLLLIDHSANLAVLKRASANASHPTRERSQAGY